MLRFSGPQSRQRKMRSGRTKSRKRRISLEPLERRDLLAVTYGILDLGTLPDTDSSVAVGISNNNEVVGNSLRTGLVPQSHAFRWDAVGGMEDLGTLGGTDAWASAINDNGQITGVALDSDGKQDGYRYDPGIGMFDIGGLGSSAGVYPSDINLHGDVVGGSYSFGMGVGFIYTDADGIQINTPVTNTASRSTRAINDHGDVAVFSSARSWVTGGWIDDALPTALNNTLVATGSSDPFGHGGELFRYTPAGGSEALGQLTPGGHTIGNDVNESGVIVGKGDLDDGSSHALIYTDADGLIDLNHLISPDSGWELTAANGLNDSGLIVGTGLIGGQQRAILLTPNSGPDTDAPLATLEAAPVTAGGVAAFTFSVVYWDSSGVNAASLGDTDLAVTTPDGSTHAATLVGVETVGDGIRRLATYSVAAPTGMLGAQDNGDWRVTVNAGEVTDANGDPVVAGEIGTVTVAVPHEVTAGVSGPAIAQATVADSFTLSAATTWSCDAAEIFSFAIDWNGDGTTDQTVTGPSGTTVDHAYNGAAETTIRVIATDAEGVVSGEATTEITVTGAPGYQVWEFAPSFPEASRAGAGAVNWNGTLFAIGGSPFANGGEEGAVHSLAVGATSWQTRQHLDSGMLSDVGMGVLSSGDAAFFGGTLEGQPTIGAFLYSTNDGKGDKLADKTFAVTAFAFATDADGRLYSIGGANDSAQAVTSVERYDADSDSWTTLAALPEARENAAAVYDGAGHVLVIGGVNSGGLRQATVFSYSIADGAWSTIAPLPQAMEEGAAALGTDGLVYLAGGRTDSGESDRLYVFNPASGDWRSGPNMLAAHSDHAIVLGDDGFLYVMGGTSTNTVEKIDTSATSQVPVASDDNVATAEDQAVTFDVRANDADADGDPLSVSSIDGAGLTGAVVLNADGTLTYTPTADFNGTETFTYRVSDPGGQLDEATVTVTVNSDGLTAGDDTAAANEDTAISLLAADLLLNDSSVNAGAVLSIAAVDAISSQGAVVALQADGSVTYDPSESGLLQRLAAEDVVVDTFRYMLGDGTGPSESGIVAVTVTGVNDAPVADDDAAVIGYKLETVDVPGATSTSIVGLNNLGVVVGTYADATGKHIFTYDGSTFTQIDEEMKALLATQGITSSISPQGINDAGTIVGGIAGTGNMSAFTGAAGFVYDGVNLLSVQYSVRDSGLADVNNSGLAVGSYVSPGSMGQHTSVGFTYQNGQVGSVTHPDHAYLRGTWLTDATDAGTLVGNYYPGFYSRSRGFIYDGQAWTDVLVPGTTWGYATGVNNGGTVIGTQIHENGADRFGFVYDGSSYESFQYPDWSGWTTLDDINDAGVLAGSAAGHGFIARPATSTDKDTVFVGRMVSALGNDTDVDFNDSLSTLPETVASSLGAAVRILSDGRFEYDPSGSTQLQNLAAGESLVDSFTYTLVDSQGAMDTATVSISVFGTGAAGTPPPAILNAGAVTTGATDHTFTVRYTDDSAVDVATIDDNDIRVTGPNGYDVAAVFADVDDLTNGTPRTATYRITAPGGDWDGADNGVYTVTIQAGEVLDVDGNAAGAVPIGSFQVPIDAVPTLTVSGTSFASVGESVVLTLDATSSFPSDPADLFTFDLDWDDDGTYDERINGATGTQAAHVFSVGGTYPVGVRVIDKNLQSDTATHSVRITGYWRTEVGPAFPFARTGASSVNQNGTIYVLGGQPYSPDGAMDARSDYLPPGGDTWLQGAYLASNISGQGAGVDSLGRIIVFSGFELGHGQAGDAYVYDVSQGKTQGVAPRTGSPWGFAHATDDQGFIYAAGGEKLSIYPSGSDSNTTGFERYNAATDTWEQLAPLPSARAHAGAVYDGAGHILVVVGSQSRQGQPVTTILTYDIATDTWLDDPANQRYFMPPLPVALNGPQATLGADGMVYITGGTTTAINYSGSTSATYVLDPHTRAVVDGPALNNAHAYHSSVLGDDGYVYVIGGSTTPSSGGGTGAVDKINTFAPAAPEYLAAPQQYAVVGEAYDAGAFFKGNPRPTFSLVNGPDGMTVDPQTGALNWTPTIGQIGSQSVTLQAANEFGATEATFTIDTLELPPDVHAPSAPSNLRQTGGDLNAITFAWDAASDDRGVDHYKLYKWVYVSRFHKYWGVAADNVVGTELTLSPANSGRYRIAAVDAAGNEGSSTAEISAAVYAPPVLSHFATNENEFVYAIEGDGLYVGDSSQSFTPAPYVVWVAGNPRATLSVASGPQGVSVDTATGIVSWAPAAADIGTQAITIHGDNPVGAADFTFTVDVYAAGTDLIRPTTISTPSATTLTHNGATIDWTGATDNVGVVGQRVYGRLVGTTTSFVVADLPADVTSHTITSFTPDTEYMLWVSAYDAAGNEGPHAGPVHPLFITTLAAPNSPPVAMDDMYSGTEDTTAVVDALTGVLANDTDADGDALTATLVTSPSNGTVLFNNDGSFSYTPHDDYNGLDSFTYQNNDGQLDSNVARVTFVVRNVNDIPIAADDAYTTNQGRPLTVATADGLLANDSDVDGDVLTTAIDTTPTNGSVAINTDGSFTYTPADGFSGTDWFTYTANDDKADQSLPATVTITVVPTPPTSDRTFFVVDFTSKRTFEYAGQGTALGDNSLDAANRKPMGIASNAEGTKTWVVDKLLKVYVYDDTGGLMGSWVPVGPAKVDGIATDGENIWIVDRGSDRVWYYDGAAGWTSGTRNADSSFALNRKNRAPAGITTDGIHLWVVNNKAAKDEVFKYTLAGQLVGSWQLDSANSTPTGIAIDPNDVQHVWVVDAGTDRVYQYNDGANLTSGTKAAFASFALTAGNANPQGITDPRASGTAVPDGSAWTPHEPDTVAAMPHWENPTNSIDVNDDGEASPVDALTIINHLNQGANSDVSSFDADTAFLDVTADGWVSAVDVLTVINFLNRLSALPQAALIDEAVGQLAEGEGPLQLDTVAGSFARHNDQGIRLPVADRPLSIEDERKDLVVAAAIGDLFGKDLDDNFGML